MVAESIASYLKKKYNLKPEYVQSGGHRYAVATRIRQHVLDKARKDYQAVMGKKGYPLDKFMTINWIIKESICITLVLGLS